MLTTEMKKNNGKILVAVLAMAMIFAGCAVVFSEGADAGTGTGEDAYVLTNSNTVTVYNSMDAYETDTTGTSGTSKSLGDALKNQKNDEVWVLKENTYYNVVGTQDNNNNYIGSKFVLHADNLTVVGNGATIYSDYANSQMNSPVGNAHAAATVSITGDNITITDMVIQTMVQYSNEGYFYANKSILVSGSEASISDVTTTPNTLGDYPEKNELGTSFTNDVKKVVNPDYGGLLYTEKLGDTSPSVTVTGMTFNNGRVTSGYGGEGSNISIKNSTMIIGDDAAGTNSGLGDMSRVNVEKFTIEVYTSDVNDGVSDIINKSPAGTEVNIKTDVTINDATVVPKGVNVIVSSEGSIDNQSSFTLSEGSTLTNNGSITGNILAAESGSKVDGTNAGSVNTTPTADDDNLGLRGTIQSNFSVIDFNWLSGDLVIAEGVTLTVSARGSLDLGAYNLVVKGTLVIERNGVVTSTSGGKILLGTTGTIDNSGVIGNNSYVTVGVNDGTGEVTLYNVSGVNFGLIREGKVGEYTYTLSVTGNIARAVGATSAADKIVTINNAIVNGDLTTSKEVTLTGEFTVAKGGNVTTNGVLDAVVNLQNGSSATVGGQMTDDAEISAATFSKQKAQDVNSGKTITYAYSTFKSEGAGCSITGFTVSVERDQYTQSSIVYYNQKAYLSGSIGTTSTGKDVSATLNVTGLVYIASDETVSLSNSASIENGSSDLFVVEGTMQNVSGELNFVGAYYTITPENQTNGVGYITNFDNAMSNIAKADNGMITLSGKNGYETKISGTYTVAKDQMITAKPSTDSILTISENGVITVEDGAILENAAIKDIDGMVVVMYGGSCTPSAEKYDVRSTNDDGDVTYAGLQVMLNNAQAGETITVSSENAKVSSLDVPNGVTLVVAEGATLTVIKTATVAEGGVLTVKGTLKIGTATGETTKAVPGTLTVAGTADITEGTLNMIGGSEDAKASISSTGSLIMGPDYTLSDNTVINGAVYLNDDGNSVVTTVSKAVAGAIENENLTVVITGTVNDSSDITLGGVSLNINGKATLGKIDVKESSIKTNEDGVLTATIIGQTGIDGETVESAFTVTDAKIDGVANEPAYNLKNQNVWTLKFDEITDGSVVISKGTVNAGTEMTGITDTKTNVKDTLTIASGATLVVDDDTEISGYKTISVDGTISVAGNLNVTADDSEAFTVSGNIVVEGAMSADYMSVSGALTVDESATSCSVTKILTVTGTVEGVVTLNDNAYALAYPGAKVSDENFNDGIKPTQFFINGNEYYTAYGGNNVVAIGERGFVSEIEIAGYEMDGINNPTKWSADASLEPTLSEGNVTIGAYPALYIELDPSMAKVQYSVGQGISLYVDDVRINSAAIVSLSVGTHKVTATVNPGYKGDVTISFNGQTVTGSFTITPEMANNNTPVVLSAIGNISVDNGVTPTTPSTSNDDDGMGLTDILLIVLVVLIAVMAVMVALRLMRS